MGAHHGPQTNNELKGWELAREHAPLLTVDSLGRDNQLVNYRAAPILLTYKKLKNYAPPPMACTSARKTAILCVPLRSCEKMGCPPVLLQHISITLTVPRDPPSSLSYPPSPPHPIV